MDGSGDLSRTYLVARGNLQRARQMGWVAVALAGVIFAIGLVAEKQDSNRDAISVGFAVALIPLFFGLFILAGTTLMARQRWGLTVGPTGLELLKGRTTVAVPWADLEGAQVISSSRRTRELEVYYRDSQAVPTFPQTGYPSRSRSVPNLVRLFQVSLLGADEAEAIRQIEQYLVVTA